MTTKQLLGIFALLTATAIALMPITSLGVVYAVLTTCILLALLPLAIETLLTVETTNG